MINVLYNLFRKRLPQKRMLMYGLQRSGTNYMETLMDLNYPDARFLNGIVRHEITHKHFRLYPQKSIIPEPQFANSLIVSTFEEFERALPFEAPDLYIIVSKDPYSWYASYVRWSKKNNWPPHTHHYIEEYNLFYGMWMRFAQQTDRILFIRYDDLLTDPHTCLNHIAQRVHWPERTSIRTTNKVYASRRFSAAKKEAHLSGAAITEIGKMEVAAINAVIDSELVTYMGYPLR